MKEAFRGITIVVGSLLFVVVMVDVLLNDRQRYALNTAIVRYWSILDDLKKRKLLDYIQYRARWLVATGILLAVGFISWVEVGKFMTYGSSGVVDIFFVCVLFIPGLLFGYIFARWTLNARTLFQAALRATIFVACAYVPLANVGLITDTLVMPPVSPDTTVDAKIHALAVGFTIIMTINVAVYFETLSVLFWLPVGLPLLLIYVFTVLLYIGEFLLRRLAEYSKGSLVALAVVLGAIVALLKAIG